MKSYADELNERLILSDRNKLKDVGFQTSTSTGTKPGEPLASLVIDFIGNIAGIANKYGEQKLQEMENTDKELFNSSVDVIKTNMSNLESIMNETKEDGTPKYSDQEKIELTTMLKSSFDKGSSALDELDKNGLFKTNNAIRRIFNDLYSNSITHTNIPDNANILAPKFFDKKYTIALQEIVADIKSGATTNIANIAERVVRKQKQDKHNSDILELANIENSIADDGSNFEDIKSKLTNKINSFGKDEIEIRLKYMDTLSKITAQETKIAKEKAFDTAKENISNKIEPITYNVRVTSMEHINAISEEAKQNNIDIKPGKIIDETFKNIKNDYLNSGFLNGKYIVDRKKIAETYPLLSGSSGIGIDDKNKLKMFIDDLVIDGMRNNELLDKLAQRKTEGSGGVKNIKPVSEQTIITNQFLELFKNKDRKNMTNIFDYANENSITIKPLKDAENVMMAKFNGNNAKDLFNSFGSFNDFRTLGYETDKKLNKEMNQLFNYYQIYGYSENTAAQYLSDKKMYNQSDKGTIDINSIKKEVQTITKNSPPQTKRLTTSDSFIGSLIIAKSGNPDLNVKDFVNTYLSKVGSKSTGGSTNIGVIIDTGVTSQQMQNLKDYYFSKQIGISKISDKQDYMKTKNITIEPVDATNPYGRWVVKYRDNQGITITTSFMTSSELKEDFYESLKFKPKPKQETKEENKVWNNVGKNIMDKIVDPMFGVRGRGEK